MLVERFQTATKDHLLSALEEIGTKVVESGQKTQIKTPCLNVNVSPLSTCDPIDQNAS